PEGSSHSRKVTKPDQRVRMVCTDCNTGWMSTNLEEPMKAATSDIILVNKRKTFSPQDCGAIAAWAFKTTILANHIELRGGPFFPMDERSAFAHDRSIPKGVHVWIAQRNAGYLKATYRSIQRLQQPSGALTPHLVRPPDSPYAFKTYTCTFSIGYLLLQVIAARWAKREVAQRLDFPPVFQPEVFKSYATTIWPNTGFSVGWPPHGAIDNTLFERFWDRFKTFNIPPWMQG
ncbi:MAG: hypothetical protein ACXVJU_14945, partial [Candidatus Angelobacter sp.]